MPTLLKNENIKKTKFEKYKKFKKDPFPPIFLFSHVLSFANINSVDRKCSNNFAENDEKLVGDQCDQIGLFFKLLGDKFSYNSSTNVC